MQGQLSIFPEGGIKDRFLDHSPRVAEANSVSSISMMAALEELEA
jgi:hypothetical protein